MRIHLLRHSSLDEALSRLLYLKKHPKRRLHESLSDWADREVKIACKKEEISAEEYRGRYLRYLEALKGGAR